MSVRIDSVSKGSLGYRKGIRPGDTLVSLNGNEVFDVLDYRFFGAADDIYVQTINSRGKLKTKHIRAHGDVDALGFGFDTYLMDKKQRCRNKCIFCFVDQMPPGMRESLYFKDDDSRLSFFFGNYITLTAVSEREVQRIIDMHISPINISVHTMNPELRVKMMGNPRSGDALKIIDRLSDAGIKMNTQLVLCPGINDGEELRYSLDELSKRYPQVQSVAAVPVGLTDYREGLYPLVPYTAETACNTLDIIDEFNEHFRYFHGFPLCFPADEFYIKAGRNMPEAEYYGDFSQLENGVGMWALTKQTFIEALKRNDICQRPGREVFIATGEAAYPLLAELVRLLKGNHPDVSVNVIRVENRFFGRSVTVAGLLTGKDLSEQLRDVVKQGSVLLLPSSTIKTPEERVFLDDMRVETLSERLNVQIEIIGETDGEALLNAILGK
ncbi:MAG: DUF512 domain-containing protein [Clostridia bacterium]|nr:DUF512 domain-containing protein [Clostridia bacterium]